MVHNSGNSIKLLTGTSTRPSPASSFHPFPSFRARRGHSRSHLESRRAATWEQAKRVEIEVGIEVELEVQFKVEIKVNLGDEVERRV
jgi:hypothetical protein